MDKLTPEQRDWIKEYANRLVDEGGSGWKAFYNLCDWLDANTAEDEPKCPDCGGRVKSSRKNKTDFGIGSFVDTSGYRCVECKIWFRKPLITEDEDE